MQRVCEARFDDVGTIDANYVRRTDAEIFAKAKGAGPRDAREVPAR